MTDDGTRPEPERDDYGRYLIVPPEGGRPKAHTRVTKIADTLDDRWNLENWRERMVALGLAARPDIFAEVASLKPNQTKAIQAVCTKAKNAAKGDAGANLGTALHRFVERVNHGEEVNVPAPWDLDIATYQAVMKAQGLGIDRRYLEGVVVLGSLGVAGTFDMLVWRDGKLVVADLKTAARLDWSWCSITAQLSMYAHGETLYDIATKTHLPMPEVDQEKALVIHLPVAQATCTVYEVDIVAGWEATQHCLWAREWQKRGKSNRGKTALAKPVVTWGEEPKRKRTFGDELRARTPIEDAVITIADPASVEMVRRRFDRLPGDAKAWCDAVAAQASVANKPISLAAVSSPSLRVLEIGRALVRFATLDPDDRLLRGALEHVVGEQQPNVTLGAMLGALTFAQAEALNDLAVAINDGKRTVVYTDDSVQLPAA